MGSTMVGSFKLQVTDIDKHTSLLKYGNNYGRKKVL